MTSHKLASAPKPTNSSTLRKRAAQARDAAGRFLKRTAGQVTDQPQPASLPEASAADRHDGDFPAAAQSSHDAGRGHSANFDRATAENGRAPHREHDMGRHETFENAAPISDALLAGTILGRAATVAFPAPGSAEAKAAFKAACHEHSVRTAALNECPELTRVGGGAWTRQSLGKAMDTGEVSPAEYARLYPLASERELQIEAVGHELNLGSLFALAHADEYPLNANPADTDTSNGDAELLAFSKDWEAAAAAYEQAIQDQIIITDRAPIIETPPSREPFEDWVRLIPGWRERTGVEAAEAATADAMGDLCEIEDRISNMPAVTLAGLKLKARVAQRNEEVSWPEGLEESLVRDILAIGELEIEADTELLRLGAQFETARQRENAANEACNAAELEADRQMPERPACLFFRASDERLNVYKNLVLPEYLEKRKVCSTDVERLRRIMPMNHEVLRPIRPGERAHIDHPGRKFDIVPYPEAQARAEEIVSAWDGWCAAKATIAVQHQQPELDAAADAAEGATIAIAHRIAAQPAQTAAGFRVKIRALAHYNTSFLWTSVPELPDPDQTLAHSLWRDVREERLPAADPTDWNSPPPGFMAYPADDPQGFVIIREGLRMELERLHRIALAEYARKVGPDASEATRSRVRQELRLDILAPAPLREEAFTATPALNDLSAQILALWPVWAAHTGDEGTDEQTVAYEAIQERRFNLLDTVDALPATPENIQPKALALAWLHYVNEWRRGQKRSEYCIDERLAIDIHIAALAQGETRETAARRPEPSLLGMLDLASATMDELRVIHDVADLVGGVAYAVTWQGRCKPRGQWGDHNAAGKLMQWLGDALTDVETATNEEAARRSPSNSHDRERRLAMRAVNIIESNETDRLTAFAHELLAHAEAERQGR